LIDCYCYHRRILSFPTRRSSDLKPLIVVLDGVEDPHNLGAVIRTAEACGVSGIVVPERHSAPMSATVGKASAGASAYMPVVRVKDRKSTRLNSSHQITSYAVFCS